MTNSQPSATTPIHERLVVWSLAVDLAVAVVHVTRRFPVEERNGMISQMRRAAFSVPSNIAEGNGQSTRRAFAHWVGIARGSLYELQTQMVVAHRCGWITEEDHQSLREASMSVGKMLNALGKSLKRNPGEGS